MNLKEKLARNKIAIQCDTLNKAKKLFKIFKLWEIESSNFYEYYWEKDICYSLDDHYNEWRNAILIFYKKNNYEIWSFEKFIEEYNKEIEMTDKELIQQIRSGKGVSVNDIERMSQATRNNEKSKGWENILQEIFGNNIKFDIIGLDDIAKNTKNATKEFYTNSGLENLLESIVRTHTEQECTKETNLTSKDEYFFKELETAKKAILEAKTLDKKTILFSKERERLQGAILEYCHKKDWNSTIEFTLSEEILNTNLRNEFLKSVCEEFGLTFLSSSKTRNCQDVEFEIKTN